MSAQQDVPMPTPANRVGRIGYFDVAKGVSIALVAFFHTTGGFVSASIMDSPPALNFLNTMAYGFHVHLFFAISGYFSVRAARRGNSLRNRMLSLYYPYLLWSVISFLASSAAANTTNNSYSWYELLLIPVRPILHYWFLLSLMVGIALLHVFRTQTALIASAVAALTASMFLPGWLHDTAYFYPFTVIGALFAMRGSLPSLRPWIATACFFFLIAGVYLAVETGMSGLGIRNAPFVLFSLAGCYALLYCSKAIAANPVGRALAYLGENSLAIYLVHVLVAASLRILLYKADPGLNPVVGIAICFAASIGLSLMAKDGARRLGLSKLAGFEPILTDRQPTPKRRLAPTVAP